MFPLATFDYFRRICAICLEASVTPAATFHHVTGLPWIAGLGA